MSPEVTQSASWLVSTTTQRNTNDISVTSLQLYCSCNGSLLWDGLNTCTAVKIEEFSLIEAFVSAMHTPLKHNHKLLQGSIQVQNNLSVKQ